MSTNLEYRETERQRKKKVGRQASEPQREKEIEREKKTKGDIFKRRHVVATCLLPKGPD